MIIPLTKIAIIENAATDNVVRLSNINSGVDGASEFGYSISENERSIRDNHPNLISNTHQLDIRTLEDEGSQEHLDNWTRDNTPVYISGITLDGFFLWGDKETTTGATRLYKNYQFDKRRSNKIFARSDELPGFDASTGIFNGGVWVGDNGLGAYEWADTDGDGIADGWSNTFGSFNFTGGNQTLNTGDTLETFSRTIYFPLEGVDLTFSLTNVSRTGPHSGDEEITIYFYNASDSLISSTTTGFASTGRKSVTETTPDNTVSVKCEFSMQAQAGSTVINEIADPMLALGTGTTYTKF